MILTYEKNLVSRFYSFDRKLTSCLFSDKVETLTAKSPKVMYPAMIFYREVDDWSFMNTPRLVDGPKVADFFIMPINYVGKIYMEKTSECIDYAKKLVHWWGDNSYMDCEFFGENINVGLRLLYIKVVTDRDVWQDRSPQRYVEFKWMSNLFLAQTTDWPTYSGFRIVLSSTDSTDPKIEIYNSENNE